MSGRSVKILRAAVAAAAIVFIGIGLWLGQYGVVLQKAIRICLECIGIG